MKTDFGSILDKWEGKKSPNKKVVEHKKSENKVTKSFEEILAEYDGYKSAPIIKAEKKGKVEAKKDVIQKPSVNSVTKDFGTLLGEFDSKKKDLTPPDNSVAKKAETLSVEQLPKNNPFFVEENEEDKRDKKAVWSIYGDNKPVVREVEKKVETKEEVKPQLKKSEPYVPSKDFGTILGEYADSVETKKSYEKIKTELKSDSQVEKENHFFLAENDEDKRDKNAVWSIYGDNKPVVREVENTTEEVKPQIKKSEPYKPTKGFEQILSEYKDSKEKVAWSVNSGSSSVSIENFKKAIEKEEVETFEEIMRKKGDLSVVERKLTITELRTMLPEATLDLHGLTEKEAKDALVKFLKEAKEEKLRKICVIHGKGLHSQDGIGVLKSVVELTLKESGVVSESFAPKAQYGGSGALWIILKEN